MITTMITVIIQYIMITVNDSVIAIHKVTENN